MRRFCAGQPLRPARECVKVTTVGWITPQPSVPTGVVGRISAFRGTAERGSVVLQRWLPAWRDKVAPEFFDLILVLDVIEHLLIPVMPTAYGSERAVVFRLRRKEIRPGG